MSHFIRLDKVSFSYDACAVSVLKEISIGFYNGWTAISGVNGSGKTTLLNLLCKQLVPQSGVIEIRGSIGYLAQNQKLSALEMDELRHDYSKKAVQLKARLELNDLFDKAFFHLSFGEQRRLCLAYLLRKRTDILMVDEPTNHADCFTKELIYRELKQFNGVGVIVSHDRTLLHELTQKTIFLENGRALIFDASFSNALTQQHQLKNHQKESRQNQLKLIEKQAKSLQLKNETVIKKAKCLSKKRVAKKDHDQKERINRAKLFGRDKSDSQTKKVFEGHLKKSLRDLASMEVRKEYRLGAFFNSCDFVKPVFFAAQEITKNGLTIKFPAISLHPKKPVAIVGKNGSGKSTLLRYLYSLCLKEKSTFIPQELSDDEKLELFECVKNISHEERGKLLSLVRRLGSDPSSINDGFELSPGLWQKLALASAVIASHSLIMMDEPTNHMDITAIELLEEALKDYQGMLLVISHDQAFIKDVCVEKIELIRQGNVTRAHNKITNAQL